MLGVDWIPSAYWAIALGLNDRGDLVERLVKEQIEFCLGKGQAEAL